MAVVVVGGHTRNIGKTSVVAGLIAAFPERSWTAIKVTQFGHGICSADGKSCDCDTGDHTVAISEERRASGTDSGRYLGSGATRSLWVRTRQGQLVDAMPRLRKEMAASENTIIESNSILRFLQPDLYLSVLDPANPDFKSSARQFLDRADALIVPSGRELQHTTWNQLSPTVYRGIPIFPMAALYQLTSACLQFIADRLRGFQIRSFPHIREEACNVVCSTSCTPAVPEDRSRRNVCLSGFSTIQRHGLRD